MYQEQPLVTVIINTFNVSWCIERCLVSLKQQTYQNIELLVVDKYSTDGTRETAEKMGACVINAPIERTTQMNFGAKNAQGKYVYFTGADIEYDSDYIEKAVDLCENQGYDAVIVSVTTKSDNFWGKAKGLERLTYLGDDLIETARFMKKEVFFAIGGWDENLVAGEDYDLQVRLNKHGYKTGRVPGLSEKHLGEPESLKVIWKKNFYYGRTFVNYLSKNPVHGAKQLFPVRTSFIRRFDVFLKEPVLFAGLIIIKITQYTAGSLGLIAGVLSRVRGKSVFS